MTKEGTDDILYIETIWVDISPCEKGKPFERMGHKALEPTSLERLKVVSCHEGEKDICGAHSSDEE